MCRPYDLKQTSIWHQKFTIENLSQKGPQNPSLCRALLNHRLFYPVCHNCRSLSVCLFVVVVVSFLRSFAPPVSLSLSLSAVPLLGAFMCFVVLLAVVRWLSRIIQYYCDAIPEYFFYISCERLVCC